MDNKGPTNDVLILNWLIKKQNRNRKYYIKLLKIKRKKIDKKLNEKSNLTAGIYYTSSSN